MEKCEEHSGNWEEMEFLIENQKHQTADIF